MDEKKVKVSVTQVTIFQPGAEPAIYSTDDPKVVRIEAGLVSNVPKVIVEKKDGTRVMSIGLPYTVFTDPPVTNNVKASAKNDN